MQVLLITVVSYLNNFYYVTKVVYIHVVVKPVELWIWNHIYCSSSKVQPIHVTQRQKVHVTVVFNV